MRPFLVLLLAGCAGPPRPGLPRFLEETIDRDVGCCYGLAILDVNRDGRPDIVMDTEYPDRVVWYENPTWKRRVIAEGQPEKPEPLQPFDVDGDGAVELILGADWSLANTASGGTLWMLRPPADLGNRWDSLKIGEEPSLHRLRLVRVDGKRELLCSSLMGRGTKAPEWWVGSGAAQFILRRPADPFTGRWEREPITSDLHVVHGVWPFDWEGDGQDEVLFAAYEGIFLYRRQAPGRWAGERLSEGHPGTGAMKGASDVRVGRLPGGRRYLVAIEPNHGPEAALYLQDGLSWKRRVLVEGHSGGHVLQLADMTGTGVESVVLGFRGPARPPDFVPGQAGKDYVLYLLHPLDAAGERWEKSVVDAREMAADSAEAADLDGDGRLDLVAGGYVTRNLKIYWNLGR